MDEKRRTLLEKGTWEIVAKPEGVKPVPIKWVYSDKSGRSRDCGAVQVPVGGKRLVQKQGIDFDEVYAQVNKHTTLCALLAVIAELNPVDVKTAFLNGALEEEIYMQQPQGYKQGGPEVGCRLKRTLYGVRQTPRAAWHMRLNLKEELGNLDFVASMGDAALSTGLEAGDRVYLVVWVDDILVAARGAEGFAKVKAHLAEKFDVHDLDEATYFLGMELTRVREARTMKLTRKKLTMVGGYGLADTRRLKHIDVVHHFAWEHVARKEVAFAYCRTEDMKADIMIKALAPGTFKKCKSEIEIALSLVFGGVLRYEHLRTEFLSDSMVLGSRRRR
ncbi:hypothetical protein KFL_002050210 [Klebsormidium nitens]|uniref:Reverse transcriptase Ty1/copia-type domain-containing protein n=1 Tax=Klebsormidium nitens TaxID=105231 RepID=A0A1Y1I9M5_KLENI|nr:hypothetical protein KFL_002050210 [Klebsormidium nitens]|eukprot:GAQ84778.1 hypothetical protein KFL_002050210 [Klebsormidium nitens]